MIRIDRGGRSVVVVCTCGARDVFASPAAADRWAIDHVYAAHPRTGDQDTDAARDRAVSASSARRRRAGD
jgi:hypothetical protein